MATHSVLPEQVARLFSISTGHEGHAGTVTSSPVEILSNGKLASAAVTHDLIESFFGCTGTLFYVFSRDETSQLFKRVYHNGNATNSSLGALYAIAAVGAQYDANVETPLRKSLYETAKFNLDECIEEDEVLAMRVLSLLSMYCIMEKRITAWTWIVSGLKLARLRGIHSVKRPSATSVGVWIEQKKVFRTLTFLAGWLSATLGRNPEITEAFQPDSEQSLHVLAEDSSVESTAQRHMTSAIMLAAGVLRDVVLSERICLQTIREYKARISQWLKDLPETMQLQSLIQNRSLTVTQRRAVFLVHLNYLGSLLLLYRRLLFYLSTKHRALPWDLDGSQDEAILYVEDCIKAAKESSQIIGLLLSEKAIFKRCWLVIYQSFSACIILLFYVAQKRLHGCSYPECEEELRRASTCLSTLSYCATGDDVAKGYADLLTFYYNALASPNEPYQEILPATAKVDRDDLVNRIQPSAFPPPNSSCRAQESISDLATDVSNCFHSSVYLTGWRSDPSDERKQSERGIYNRLIVAGSPFQWPAS